MMSIYLDFFVLPNSLAMINFEVEFLLKLTYVCQFPLTMTQQVSYGC